jgi:large subunit ribosomal protein L24
MQKIRCKDKVIVISGKDKGKKGSVLFVREKYLLVSGVNILKKHQKPNPKLQKNGGIIEKESFIAASNVAIYNTNTSKRDKVGIRKLTESNKKVRFFKSTGDLIDS